MNIPINKVETETSLNNSSDFSRMTQVKQSQTQEFKQRLSRLSNLTGLFFRPLVEKPLTQNEISGPSCPNP